ncbi:hypothetical protein KL86DPRO_11800 [uncultured delta proteobacterium]|uniref:YkgJ family cysteine cluster protein n=1 Tax=uncultured delta proteobacterium TaxID=34034 RepID=A0A212JM91_9DELT|nr:hypothetical protein KL86DPRO_11800 [uncultured delta proteobacterium]
MERDDRALAGVFACRRCGECCSGQGGIILRETDSERLAAFLGLPVAVFHERFAEESRGKKRLIMGKDGGCVFFGAKGCSVHPAKPDVCRAWPFFRGNLTDPVSFAMAKQGCPGIPEGAAFAVFCRTGARELLSQGIFTEPEELRVPAVLLTKTQLIRLAGDDTLAGSGGDAGDAGAGEV